MAEIATGNRDDALDIVQDAMCRLVERYHDREPDTWAPLFYRILHNRIKDWYRREKRRGSFFAWTGRGADANPQAPAADVSESHVESQPDRCSDEPDRHLERGRVVNALDSAIRALPLRQQQALLLRLFEGLDVAQTATIMRCTQGSVKTHYSRALACLREKLRGHWP